MSTSRIEFLDYARGYSILSIVIYHLLQFHVQEGAWSRVIAFGGSGVHAFLFLSGFGLTLSATRGGCRGFYRRRLTKVLLPYYLFVTTLFVLNFVYGLYPDEQGTAYAYLGHILLYKMFDESIVSSYGYHLWFMSTIVQLYLLFPALFFLKLRWGADRLLWLAGGVSAVATIFICIAGLAQYRIWNSSGLVVLWEFVLGIWAADRYLKGRLPVWEVGCRVLVAVGTAAIVVLFAGLVLGEWLGRPDIAEVTNNPAAFFAYMAILIGTFQMANRGWLPLLKGFLLAISAFSYELYLIHGVVTVKLYGANLPTSPIMRSLMLPIVVGLLLALAAAYHHIVVRLFVRDLR